MGSVNWEGLVRTCGKNLFDAAVLFKSLTKEQLAIFCRLTGILPETIQAAVDELQQNEKSGIPRPSNAVVRKLNEPLTAGKQLRIFARLVGKKTSPWLLAAKMLDLARMVEADGETIKAALNQEVQLLQHVTAKTWSELLAGPTTTLGQSGPFFDGEALLVGRVEFRQSTPSLGLRLGLR